MGLRSSCAGAFHIDGADRGTILLHGNSQLLVNTLEALPLLEGRFSSIKLINVANGAKRGNFSLVFSAYDELEGRQVALKFFDLDPTKRNKYRLLCFEREHEILQKLKGAPRCLQLCSDFHTYDLSITIPGQSSPVSLPAQFFAVDWLEDDIDEFFNRQEVHSAVDKLMLFNDVVLAVESLHSRLIFHRDLKVDNFRSKAKDDLREVVAIDLGAAARYESTPILAAYGCPVGLLMYSAPEAFCGMSGVRSIAPLSDMFALGCMLFELFHPDDYPTAYRTANSDFDFLFSVLKNKVDAEADPAEKIKIWNIEAAKLLRGLAAVSLSEDGSSAPAAVADLLSELVAGMTEPNFNYRWSSFSKVRQRCWTAIRVLENESLAKRRAQQAASRRAAKAAKALERAQRVTGKVKTAAVFGGGSWKR